MHGRTPSASRLRPRGAGTLRRVVDPYAHETYSGREGEIFRMHTDTAVVDARLESVEVHDPRTSRGFTLTFVAPGEPQPQRIYAFDHDELETLEIFVVPIGTTHDGVRYEAVFTSTG